MAPATDYHDCSTRVYSGARWDFNGHHCLRRGTVEHNGKWYCKQHSPEAVKEREAAKNAAYDAERAREERIKQGARKLAARLGAGTPHYSPFTHKYTGDLVLSAREVEILIERLGDMS